MRSRGLLVWDSLKTIGILLRASVTSIGHNWALGLFSVAAAFTIWFAVEEVDNPRQEGVVPIDADQRIRVETVNVPDGLVANEPQSVRVRVRARTDLIPQLGPADFRATVDLRDISSPQVVPTARVEVKSLREDVRVLSVEPSVVQVVVEQASSKEVAISVAPSGALPDGFRLLESPAVDPGVVEISGPPELVERVAKVEVSANLTGQREPVVEFDAPLVARTANGNVVTVTIKPQRAKVTLKIEQVNQRRLLPIDPKITGVPGPGFQITGVTYDPQTIGVTGPTSVLDSLTRLTLDGVDVSNATRDVVGNKQIVKVPNVTFDRQTVQVTVHIEPTSCSDSVTGSCNTGTCFVGPTFEGIPANLTPDPAQKYQVQVTYLAATSVDQTLSCDSLKATVSLAAGSAGVASYAPKVSGPSSVTIVSVEPISVRLITAQQP